MLCIYCEKAITESTPSCNVGGAPMHCSCQSAYSQELEDSFGDYDCGDMYDDGHYDNDPSPYEGTYSEM